MKNNPINFTFNLTLDTGETANIWLPQPIWAELAIISRPLAYIFTEANTLPYQVFITDWERVVNESLDGLRDEQKEKVKKDLEAFFARMIAGGYCDLKNMNDFSEYELNDFKGTLLFISALYRYVYARTPIQSEKSKAFFTSLTQAEWQKSLLSSKDSSEELVVVTSTN